MYILNNAVDTITQHNVQCQIQCKDVASAVAAIQNIQKDLLNICKKISSIKQKLEKRFPEEYLHAQMNLSSLNSPNE